MMTTNQKVALTDAHAQPSASSSPKRARRRGAVRWGALLGHAVLDYLTVSVPVMAGIGWTEQMKVYVPAASGRTA